MDLNEAVGAALRDLRVRNGASQEKVGLSQSYVSDVERGFKALSIDKLDEFAANIGVHPMSILAKAYLIRDESLKLSDLLKRLDNELSDST
jgi:transcriptional regulator with XRE-family HTH domain